MKKLIHFVIVLLFVGYQNSKAQTDIFHDSRVAAVLKQAAAGDPDLLLFGRKSAGNYVNMAVLDKKHHTLSWFTCYGQQYDVVQLLDNQYEAVLSKKVEPFDLCKHFYLENLAFTEDAESQFRQLGNAALADTSRNRQAVYNYPQVKAAASTLQKVMAMESLLKKYSLQLYLLDAKSPHHLRHNDSLTLREPLAGRMIRRGDTTTYYNAYPLSAATRIVLCQKTPERMFVYDSRAQLIDSVPLKPGKFAALLKTQEDVFLLYRGWLELQSQQIMYDKLETAERLNRRDTGLYTQAYLLDNEDQLSRALLELQAQQLIIERKISRLLLPEDRMVDHILREHYTNAGPEISYAPGIGFAYTVNYVRGQKNYELGEHRGNVMAVVSDKKNAIDGNTDGVIDYYVADVINANDYYPFGSLMPGRTNNNDKKYRYGFNGKENDDEVKGEGNQQDYGMRIYDPRVGRFLSVDPLAKSYPWNSTYAFAENDVIRNVDLDGLEKALAIYSPLSQGISKISITRIASRKGGQLQNMEINFSDKTKNDQSQFLLRIQNGFIIGDRKPKIQENDERLDRFETFIANGKGTVEKFDDEKFQQTVEDDGKEVGLGKWFSNHDYMKIEHVGFVAGGDFRWDGIKTVDEKVGFLLDRLKNASGMDHPEISINISTSVQLDNDAKSSYDKLLKDKYGKEIQITWGKQTKNKERNTNVSIAIRK